MPNASIDGRLFDIDPSSASWTYTLNTKSFDTYGGRVVQILSRSVDSMSVSGYISSKGLTSETRWSRMEKFEHDVRQLMDKCCESGPVMFRYPPLGWEGLVYVTGYSNVRYDVETSAVSYRLDMAVDDGFQEIRPMQSEKVALSGLDAIPSGVNWVRGKYNTSGMSWTEIYNALEKAIDAVGRGEYTGQLYDYVEQIMESEGVEAGDVDVESESQTEMVGSSDSPLEEGYDCGATEGDSADSQYSGSSWSQPTSRPAGGAF